MTVKVKVKKMGICDGVSSTAALVRYEPRCDFQQYGILTHVDSGEAVQPLLKLGHK